MEENTAEQCWASTKIHQDWHVRAPWEWEMYAAGGGDRFERLPMAEWAGSDPDPCFNLGKELHLKSMSDSSETVNIVLTGGNGGFGEVLNVGIGHTDRGGYSDERNSDLLKSSSSGWLAEASSPGNAFCNNNEKNVDHFVVGLGSNGGFNGAGSDVHGDSLTCLKLGKRQYYEDNNTGNNNNSGNYGKSVCFLTSGVRGSKKTRAASASATQPPRCQVQGCNVVLTNAKDYHRRHKVCEIHAKATKVIVNSLEQRFCQQCSRFHVISEFDDAKRSCRRRLAGHNERRRKSSSESFSHSFQEEKRMMSRMGESELCFGNYSMQLQGFPSSPGSALSLLSSQKPPFDDNNNIDIDIGIGMSMGISRDLPLSYRSSIALKELIAQNRFQQAQQQQQQQQQRPAVSRAIFQGANHPQFLQEDEDDLQENMENCRFLPGLRSLQMKEHDYGLLDSNNINISMNVVRPTLDLMHHHSDSLLAIHRRNNASSSSSSSEEKCGFWKSLEGTEIA